MHNLIVATNTARKRKKNPTGKRKTSAKQRAAAKRNIKKAQAANRRRGRSTTKKRPASRSRSRTTTKKRTRKRSNPTGFKGIVDRQIMPAAIGGAGAVLDDMLVNAAFRFLPIPAQFQAGPLRHVAKAVGAIIIGQFGSYLPMVTKRTADQLGAGAMTVVGYNVVRDLATRFVPQLPLGEYLEPQLGYYGAGLNPGALGEYLDPNALGAWDSVGVGPQLTQGTPYLDGWPVESEEYVDYDM